MEDMSSGPCAWALALVDTLQRDRSRGFGFGVWPDPGAGLHSGMKQLYPASHYLIFLFPAKPCDPPHLLICREGAATLSENLEFGCKKSWKPQV